MTNTRLTDPEVLEQRYPVRVRQFSIRKGTGGAGHFRGGDGIVRELEFLKPLDAVSTSRPEPAIRHGGRRIGAGRPELDPPGVWVGGSRRVLFNRDQCWDGTPH